MRNILILALFFVGTGAAGAAIAVMWWIAAGTYSRMNPRDPSSYGPILFGRYRRHGIAALVLMAAAVTVFTLLTIVDKHLQ
jgi:hypothetical protein